MAVLSLLIAGYGAWEQRQQRLAVRPKLVVDANWDPAFGLVGLTLQNAGEGPAEIRSMSAFVNGVEVKLNKAGTWPLVVGLLGVGALAQPPLTTWYNPGDSIQKGAHRIPLFVLRPPFELSEIDAFQKQALRVGLLICYCSSFADCYEARENLEAVGDAKCDYTIPPPAGQT